MSQNIIAFVLISLGITFVNSCTGKVKSEKQDPIEVDGTVTEEEIQSPSTDIQTGEQATSGGVSTIGTGTSGTGTSGTGTSGTGTSGTGTTVTAAFQINAAAALANSLDITLDLDDDSHISTYRVAIGSNCSAATYQSYGGGSQIAFTLAAGEGARTVCLQVKAADNTESETETDSITIDTIPPTASYSDEPSDPSVELASNFSVGGVGVTHYRYKIGVAGSTNCTVDGSYSAETAIATPIAQDLAAQIGQTLKLCLIGKDEANNWQALADATSYSWDLDAELPPDAPTSLNLTDSYGHTIAGQITSGGGSTAGFVVLRRKGTSVSVTPTQGTSYSTGEVIDANHRVAYAGSGTAFTDLNLEMGDTYHYAVFAVNSQEDYSSSTIANQLITKHIYRSVGPGQSAAIASGGPISLTLSGSLASFSAGLANEIGVGDILLYDTDANAAVDARAMIVRRNSSTEYLVRMTDGNAPTAAASTVTWNLYRAYTSLANAEAGTENSGIPSLNTFDAGNRDIASQAEIWNFACYAGSAADTTHMTIDGWTTSVDHFLKIYTPVASWEVGASQRHAGVWSNSSYRLVLPGPGGSSPPIVQIQDNHVVLDGIQIQRSSVNSGSQVNINLNTLADGHRHIISNNIIVGANAGVNDYHAGIDYLDTDDSESGELIIANNILYGFTSSTGPEANCLIIEAGQLNLYAYNNTLAGCKNKGMAIYDVNNAMLVNNLVQIVGTAYDVAGASSTTGSSNNLSHDASAPGTDHVRIATVSFVNLGSDNYLLDSGDTAAKDEGFNLTEDAIYPFSTDILGQARTAPWDIGAHAP